jgi:hypothetical protein
LQKPGATINNILAIVGIPTLGKVFLTKGMTKEKSARFYSAPAQDRQLLMSVVEDSKKGKVFELFTLNCLEYAARKMAFGLEAKGERVPNTIPSDVLQGILKDVFDDKATYGDVWKYLEGSIILDDNGKAIGGAKPGEKVP